MIFLGINSAVVATADLEAQLTAMGIVSNYNTKVSKCARVFRRSWEILAACRSIHITLFSYANCIAVQFPETALNVLTLVVIARCRSPG